MMTPLCSAGRRPKRVAIVQSNYIPWRGYFDLIASVDEFILFDDMQYTRRDWRNRNVIKTPAGLQWLTVPVKSKGKFHQSIRETEIDGTRWSSQHLKALSLAYARAPFREVGMSLAEPIYTSGFTRLSELNRAFIEAICRHLVIPTRISSSWDYASTSNDKSERLVEICRNAEAKCYVSGPAARTYLDEDLFLKHGITVEWFDYKGYPAYPQLWGKFLPEVSVLDLIFNCGDEAARYLSKAGQNE